MAHGTCPSPSEVTQLQAEFGPLPLPVEGAACGSGGDPAGPCGDPPPSGDPPAPAGPLPSLGGCQIFPADNAWNRDVSADPVHPGSAALLAEMAPENSIHLDLGTTEEYYGIPYIIVPPDQPLVPITFGTGGYDYSDESDPGPMPISLDVHIEGGSSQDPDPGSGDRHVLVLRQGDCRLFELFNTVRTGSGFQVSSSATWDLTINDTRPSGWTSADAAGLPILPGLLKYEEVAAGRLHHALRFTIPRVRRAYTAPASHCGHSGDALVILTAMKRYGLILADQGSAWYVTATASPGWADALDQLREMRVRGSDFEVLVSGPVTVC
jgi:hypothetical protein